MATVAPARAASASRCPGRSFARSVTSSPIASASGGSPAARRASTTAGRPNAATQTLAASGSTATFHSLVGAVLPGDR